MTCRNRHLNTMILPFHSNELDSNMRLSQGDWVVHGNSLPLVPSSNLKGKAEPKIYQLLNGHAFVYCKPFNLRPHEPCFFVVAMRSYELTVLSCYGRAPVLRRKAAIPSARKRYPSAFGWIGSALNLLSANMSDSSDPSNGTPISSEIVL
jgi:hypothetical protein